MYVCMYNIRQLRYILCTCLLFMHGLFLCIEIIYVYIYIYPFNTPCKWCTMQLQHDLVTPQIDELNFQRIWLLRGRYSCIPVLFISMFIMEWFAVGDVGGGVEYVHRFLACRMIRLKGYPDEWPVCSPMNNSPPDNLPINVAIS